MDRKVLIYGATGGLGRAICQEYYNRGWEVVLSGRNEQRLTDLKKEIGNSCKVAAFSITEDIEHNIFDEVDVVINASGTDIRKPLSNQIQLEINNQININLFGVISLTKSVLESFKKRGKGQLLHLGGFADGSWATPCYTVDVATRAGVYSFIESINLELDNKNIIVQYFCPLPANTKAEKPYHKLWRSMGIKVVDKKDVAKDVFNSVLKKRLVTIQGDPLSRMISTKLKYIFPKLTKKLILVPMGRKTTNYINELEEIK